jgi:hypothetical protein
MVRANWMQLTIGFHKFSPKMLRFCLPYVEHVFRLVPLIPSLEFFMLREWQFVHIQQGVKMDRSILFIVRKNHSP